MTFTPRTAEEHFAIQRTTEAAEKVAAIHEVIHTQSVEAQRSYERFYNSLALFSGGTIALSVTYLGYLKTVTRTVVHPRWLMASWISLLTCLACSLFWIFLRTHYGYWARLREYMEAQKDKYEAEADEIHKINAVNLRTEAQLSAFTEPRRKAAAVRDKDARHAGRREAFYLFCWMWIGRLARVAFVFGLGMLISFAIKNF